MTNRACRENFLKPIKFFLGPGAAQGEAEGGIR